MNLIVFCNVILFAFEYHEMPQKYLILFNQIESIFCFLYTMEFIFVCACYGGLKKYLQNPWNQFDLVILLTAWMSCIG